MNKRKVPIISISILIFTFSLSFIVPHIYLLSPFELNADKILIPPSLEHLMGTDRLGRDVFSRVLTGGEVSLIIGVGSAVISSLIGLILGVSAGYFRGYFDKSFIIIVDLFLTFPTFFLLLALVSYISASTLILIIVISITGWMGTARLIRAESHRISKQPFIKVLSISKVSNLKIIFKYFMPLLIPIFLVSFTFGVSGAILAESGLSYLGLGVTPPNMSWGSILSDGKSVMEIAWWVSFFPGMMIFLVTFSLIQISDYLQEFSNRR
ncbi:Dipeptide transport system permease protein DppC (TC 3.A.1.5.2) [hydrothermal vent metagenome]|uniref:Dipeptide transport system permease protein DppC (TC 3.A.1.5.2) n=1 Tax=hydrothermal vent metagenome TaxID=652676 RepID=A0A1W1BHN6_9ZZZZ